MPTIAAETKRVPSDFRVTEQLHVEFSGDGEHAWLWVEKIGANTEWTARQLARFAGVPARDVGYSGLKDRQAITRQWFSVRASSAIDWTRLSVDGVTVLDVRRHRRKLRRGTHRSNRFRIALRGSEIADNGRELDAVLRTVRSDGVPNYFGPQRFGRGGENLELAKSWCSGKRLSRHRRSLAISTARSTIFNDILDVRERDGTWNTIIRGDVVNLEGSQSIFTTDVPDDELRSRCRDLDVHPAGSLWGSGAPLGTADAAAIERDVAERHRELATALEKAGVRASGRALRLVVRELEWEYGDDVLWLDFELTKGGYATAVLAEIVETTAGGEFLIGNKAQRSEPFR